MTAELPAPAPICLSGDPAHWTPAQRTRNERMSAFLRTLHEEGSLMKACQASGVPEPTVWRWRKDHPPFAQAVDDFITNVRTARIEENLFRIATSDDPKIANATVKAGEFLLKGYDREKWGDTLKTENTTTINTTIQIAVTVRDDLRARQAHRLAQLQARTLDAEVRSDLEEEE